MSTALINAIWIVKNGEAPDRLDMFRQWIKRQTCSSVLDGIVWDKVGGTAFALSSPDASFRAADGSICLNALTGRYICIAGDDLLQQNETYIEENILALEHGALAFTVNLRGQPEWAMQRMREGLLPGDLENPLLRQVVRRDCLKDDFKMDLSRWISLRKGFPTNAGRIICHTTNKSENMDSNAFRNSILAEGMESCIAGTDVLVRKRADWEWQTPFSGMRPMVSILSDVPIQSKLPTVIMIHTYLAVGGAEKLHLNVMRELKDHVNFIVLGIEPLDKGLGTTADEFRELTPYVYTLPDFIYPSMYWAFLCGLIERSKPAAIYMANGASLIYNVVQEVKHRFPDVRLVNQVYDHKIGWINSYKPAVAASLDAHIAANSNIGNAYIERGAPSEDVHLVEHGIISSDFDISAYDALRIEAIKQDLGIPERKRVVTFAARFNAQKRPLDFVGLAERFVEDSSVVFLMAGDGPLTEEIDNAILEKELQNIVRRPFHSPMSDVYAVTDVYVLPSAFEGMPMVIIEAQVMGKPVVVTDVGNNREMLELSGGGVVIDRIGDIDALEEGVRKMLNHPPEQKRIRELVLSKCDIRIVAEKYRRVLLGVQSG